MENFILKHFTTISSMRKILESGFRLSDGSIWEDQNDKFALDLYQKHFPYARVLCFCQTDATIYHWQYYGKLNTEKHTCERIAEEKIGCFIGLDAEKFDKYVKSLGYIFEPVQYMYMNELKKAQITIDNVLLIKRKGFKVDDEKRIICNNEKNEKEVFIPNVIEFVKKIVISGAVPYSQFLEIKESIQNTYPKIEVRRSRLADSEEWRVILYTNFK